MTRCPMIARAMFFLVIGAVALGSQQTPDQNLTTPPPTKAEIKKQNKLAKKAQKEAIENRVITDCDEGLAAERAKTTGINGLPLAERLAVLSETHAALARCFDALGDRFEEVSRQREANIRAMYSNPQKREQLRQEQESLLAQIHAVKDTMDTTSQMIGQLEVKQKHGQECSDLFRETIDKKQSDLTTRESESIKSCQALDLYREVNEK